MRTALQVMGFICLNMQAECSAPVRCLNVNWRVLGLQGFKTLEPRGVRCLLDGGVAESRLPECTPRGLVAVLGCAWVGAVALHTACRLSHEIGYHSGLGGRSV